MTQMGLFFLAQQRSVNKICELKIKNEPKNSVKTVGAAESRHLSRCSLITWFLNIP